jgi:alpha-mannosidase
MLLSCLLSQVCSHKFFDLSESGVGLSILNDCK